MPEDEVRRVREAYERREPGARSRYSYFERAFLLMAQERERVILDMLAREGIRDLEPCRILEVGTGRGRWLRDLVRWGARPGNLVGADVRWGALAEARESSPPGIRLVQADVRALPLQTSSFDLVLQSTLFTSILGEENRRAAAREMLRVVRPGGCIVWYDFRVDNPRNPDVRGVGRREVRRLFPGSGIRMRGVTLAPPVARWVAPRLPWLVGVLSVPPFLRTHLVAVIRR
jgi:ubiquinone/menaquinone biosynthesis C-methylase UbiE